jgi:hypothetical protein
MQTIKTRTTTPYLSLLKDRFEHNEIVFTSMISDETISKAILTVYHDLSPRIFAVEYLDGTLEIISGEHLVHAMCIYMSRNTPCPATIVLDEFKSKSFVALPAYLQRKLRDSSFSMTIFERIKNNADEEKIFRDAVNLSTTLI